MRLHSMIFALLLALFAATGRAQTAADGQPAADVEEPTPAAAAPARSTPARPRVDDIFRSMQTSAERPAMDIATHLVPLAVGAVGFVGAMIALAHWNRVRASRPKPVGDHRKLLNEVARATGLSATQLRRLSTLSDAAGLASPLVAAIAPSAMRDLASRATGDVERMALAKLARQVADR